MQKLSKRAGVLVDTDVFIWYFRKNRAAKRFFRTEIRPIYYSKITLKELLYAGISSSEVLRVKTFLGFYRIVNLDTRVAESYDYLIDKYLYLKNNCHDAIIAASAMSRKLVLVTANYHHFDKIEELDIEIFSPR